MMHSCGKKLMLLLFLSVAVFIGKTEANSQYEISHKVRIAPHGNIGRIVINGSGVEKTLHDIEMGDKRGSHNKVSVLTVALFTLAMAAATGLGAVPFFFVELDPQWAGICNGMAAGVMLAASFDLVKEGQEHGFGNWVYWDSRWCVVHLALQADTFEEVKTKREKKQSKKNAAKSTNHGARSSTNNRYDTGNKFNSNETRLAQTVPTNKRGHWAAGPSSAPGILGPRPNSDPKNAMKVAPTVTSSLLPATAYQSAWAKANPGKKTMAEIVKMGRPLPQKNVIVPVKDEGSSFEKQDVSSLLKPSAESKTHADQVSEPQIVDESKMNDEVPGTKTSPVSSHPDVDQVAQCSHLVFGSFGLRIGSGQASSGLNDNMEDMQETEEDSSFIHPTQHGPPQEDPQMQNLDNFTNIMYLRDFAADLYGEEEEEQLRNAATDVQTSNLIDSTTTNYHASSYYETEAAQYEPPQDYPQMQNLDNFTNVMNLRDASISPPGAGQQAASLYQHPALNPYYHHHHHGMLLGQYGNYMSYPMMGNGYNPFIHTGFGQGNHQAPLVVAGRNGFYIFPVHHNHQQPPGFVQAQHHYQQRGGEASSETQEQLWPCPEDRRDYSDV